jgi:cytochrome c-type biogenesis protein CcmI
MVLLGALLLVAAVVLFILQPVLRGQWASLVRDDDEMTEVEARRRVTLLALRDVEYEYHAGKLDEEDYRDLRRELSAEALEALDAARKESSGDSTDLLEAEIAEVRAGLKAGTVCPACAHANPAGSRFCAGCGLRLAEREERRAETPS